MAVQWATKKDERRILDRMLREARDLQAQLHSWVYIAFLHAWFPRKNCTASNNKCFLNRIGAQSNHDPLIKGEIQSHHPKVLTLNKPGPVLPGSYPQQTWTKHVSLYTMSNGRAHQCTCSGMGPKSPLSTNYIFCWPGPAILTSDLFATKPLGKQESLRENSY